MAFNEIGVELEFIDDGIDEKGTVVRCSNPNYNLEIGSVVVAVDSRYFRPTEVDLLIGDASKAKNKLGWQPKISLQDMVKEMISADLENTKTNCLSK